jgi:hypothetical protein
MKSHEKRLKVF